MYGPLLADKKIRAQQKASIRHRLLGSTALMNDARDGLRIQQRLYLLAELVHVIKRVWTEVVVVTLVDISVINVDN